MNLRSPKFLPLNEAAALLKKYPGISAFTLSLLLLLPFIRMGLDVTDPGFHLGNQLMVGRIGISYIVEQPYWWFSDLVGWWWLSLVERMGFGLVGARLGGVVLFSICAALAAHIVSKYVTSHWLVPISALSVAPFYAGFLSLISYDSVPALICLVGLCLYYIALFGERPWAVYGASLLAGIAWFFLLQSRLPAVVVAGVPIIGAIAAILIDRKRLRPAVISGGITFVVIAALSAGFYLYLVRSGLLAKIADNQPLDTHYNSEFFLAVIRQQWSLISPWLTWFVGGVLVLFVALLWPAAARSWIVGSAASFLIIFYVWGNLGAQLHDLFAGTLNFLMLVSLVVALIAVFIILLWRQPSETSRELLFRLILVGGSALALPIVVSLGSSAGLAKLQFGGYLVPPLVIALLVLLASQRRGTEATILRGLAAGLTLFAVIFAEWHLYAKGVFRDQSDRRQLVSAPEVARLGPVRTTTARAESIRELDSVLRERPVPAGRTVLVYREAPLVHYMMDDLPYRKWIWPDILPLSEIERGLPGLCDTQMAPYLVVRALQPTGNPIWGGKAGIESFAPSWQVEKYEAIDAAVERCGYRSVWKNVDFEVLMKAAAPAVVPAK